MRYGVKTQVDVEKLNVSLHISLHWILKLIWPMGITNEEIKIREEIKPISKQVARSRWTWSGHVLRRDHHLYVESLSLGYQKTVGIGIQSEG